MTSYSDSDEEDAEDRTKSESTANGLTLTPRNGICYKSSNIVENEMVKKLPSDVTICKLSSTLSEDDKLGRRTHVT